MSKLSQIGSFKEIKKLIQYGIGQGFNVIVPLIIVPYIILICGEENLGKSAISMSIAFFLIVFIDFGCDVLGVKDISLNRDDIKKRNYIISNVIYIKLFFTTIVMFIYLFVINNVNFFVEEKQMYLYTSFLIIAQIFNPLWIFQGLEKFNLFSYCSILSKSIYVLLIFFLLKSESDYVYINFSFGLSIIIGGVLFYYILKKNYQFELVKISYKELFKYINTHRLYVFSQIFVWIQLYSPIILVNFFGTNLQVGQFRVIDQIISIFKTYILLSFNFIYPNICNEINLNKMKGVKKWIKFNSVNFVLISTLLLFLFIFSSEIAEFYNIKNIDYVSNILEIALIYPVLFFIVIALKQVFLALQYEKLFSKITILMSVLNLTIVSVVFDSYSLKGVFYSFIFVEIFSILILVFHIHKFKILKKQFQ